MTADLAAPPRLRVFRGRWRNTDPAWFIDAGRDTMIVCGSHDLALRVARRILTGSEPWNYYGGLSADHVQPCNASGERAS